MKTIKRYIICTLLSLLWIHNTSSQTKEEIYEEILAFDIQHPDIVMKQCLLETGHLKCGNCSRIYNNYFGFRWKNYITENNPLGYFWFDNWRESVAYYKRWQDKYYKGGDYYAFLQRIGYAEASHYIYTLKRIQLDFLDKAEK